MDCDASRDQMLDLLYGEASEPARRAVEAHHAACTACADEFAALRGLRRDLSAWEVPAPRRRVPARALPWPGLAAAAAVLIALGATVGSGGAELRRDERGWSFRLGRPASDVQVRLDAQEARHHSELQQLRAQLATPVAFDQKLVLEAARSLVEQSERRQAERLRQAVLDIGERTEVQRRYDLAQMSAGLSYLEGRTSLHNARTNELMGQVLLASQEK